MQAAGVEHPFLPEHVDDDGNDEIAAVGVDGGSLFHGIEPEGTAHEHVEDDGQRLGKRGRNEGEKEALQFFPGEIHLKGVEHHARAHDVQGHGGKGRAVFGPEQPQPHHGIAHEHHEKHGGYLLAEKKGNNHGKALGEKAGCGARGCRSKGRKSDARLGLCREAGRGGENVGSGA